MNYEEYYDKLKSKLKFDQNKLKDKQQELLRLTNDLDVIEVKCKEREQLNSQINEKVKLVELLFKKVNANFDKLPDEISDLDFYLKQALHNKSKFELPINEFQNVLNTSLIKLNDQIKEKGNFIKLKYEEINDKLQIKKSNSVQKTKQSLVQYEQLKNDVLAENQSIAKLEDEIKSKQNLIEEFSIQIIKTDEKNKQIELKIESTLKENETENKNIDSLNVQLKKVEEDKAQMLMKVKMQDELIDCTKLMIQELENNTNLNLNYQKFKDEYDETETEIERLEKEYEDRIKIYQMKNQCKELREKKIESINTILQNLKTIETDESLEDKDTQYELVFNEIQNEIKVLEQELESKGLLSQLNEITSQQTQITIQTQLDNKDDKIEKIENLNKFENVPEELLGYLHDTEAILFDSQVENDPEIDFEIDKNKENDKSESTNLTNENKDENKDDVFSTQQFRNSSNLNNLDDDIYFSDSQFSNLILPSLSNLEIFTSSSQTANSQTSIKSANNQEEKFYSSSNTSQSNLIQSDGSQLFKTPRSIKERQTKEDKRKKSPTTNSEKVKRKRQI